MKTDIHTKMLHKNSYDREFLNLMKSLPFSEMLPGDDSDSDAPSTLMAKAVALVAEGEPNHGRQREERTSGRVRTRRGEGDVNETG